MKLPDSEIDRDAPYTKTEKAAIGILTLWPMLFIIALGIIVGGCAYKGGKLIDGTNIEIGIMIPGTELSINALSYTGGIRVCGNDATQIEVTNVVDETNSYFGVVHTERHSNVKAKIVPMNYSTTNATEVLK